MSTEEILARCIAEIERGVSIDECLSQYPEQAEELRPLLILTLTFRSAQPIRLSDRAFERGRRLLRQQIQPSPISRPQPSFIQRYQSRLANKKALSPPAAVPSSPAHLRRRTPQPYFFWVSAASSVAVVAIGTFLFVRLSNLSASNPLATQTVSRVPTYTATSANTSTVDSLTLPVIYTPAPDVTPTLTLPPTGKFIPLPYTDTPTLSPTALPSLTAVHTPSPVFTSAPIQVLATATATSHTASQPTLTGTKTPTPILAPTSTITVTLAPTATPLLAATIPETATATATLTATLTETSTLTETATAEPPTSTPTLLPPTATATDTPLEATATPTFVFGPIITLEASLTPEDDITGRIDRASTTPTPNPRPPHGTTEP